MLAETRQDLLFVRTGKPTSVTKGIGRGDDIPPYPRFATALAQNRFVEDMGHMARISTDDAITESEPTAEPWAVFLLRVGQSKKPESTGAMTGRAGV